MYNLRLDDTHAIDHKRLIYACSSDFMTLDDYGPIILIMVHFSQPNSD